MLLRKMKLNKPLISNNKNLLTHKREPIYIQLATEIFEIIHMDRKELISLTKLVPLDYKHVLDKYIKYRRIKGKN